MIGPRNRRSHPLPDLNPPPSARKVVGERLAEAQLRSTKLQRLTALGWALSFLRAPRHAGLRPILRVSRNFRGGCECREFDPVPLSFSRSLYKLVHFNTRRRLDNSMAYTCVTESGS